MSILFTFKGELDRRLIKRPEDQNNRVLKFDKLINTTLEHHACTRHCRVHFMEKKTWLPHYDNSLIKSFKARLKNKVF